MNDFFLIIFKTSVFVISYMAVSNYALKFFIKRNSKAELWDVEIMAVSVISAAFITSFVKHFVKLFI